MKYSFVFLIFVLFFYFFNSKIAWTCIYFFFFFTSSIRIEIAAVYGVAVVSSRCQTREPFCDTQLLLFPLWISISVTIFLNGTVVSVIIL